MRPSKDEYWMNIAREVATRATCKRRKVGAVLVRNNRVVSTGYNGAPEGLPHCLEAGCDIENGHCVRTVHAEANALIQAGLAGGAGTEGTTLYTTASPCRACMSLIINAGIKRVVYADPYIDPTHTENKMAWSVWAAGQCGIVMMCLEKKGE